MVATGAGADTTRRHYTLFDSTNNPAGEVTIVEQTEPKSFWKYVLFRSTSGDEFIVEQWTSDEEGVTGARIRDVGGRAQIETRLTDPFAGREVSEVAQEVRQNPELIDYMSPDTLLETNGGLWQGTETDWQVPEKRLQLTSDVRQSMSFSLLEMIERAVDTFFTTEIMALPKATIIDYIIYRPDCGSPKANLQAAMPDCGFDDAFGFPCTKDQLARVKAARSSGTVPEDY